MTVLYVFLGVLGIAVVQEAMAMNQFNTVPEGISIVEECRLYIHSGIRSVLLDKGRFLIGLIIFTSVSLFIIIVDLYNDGDREMSACAANAFRKGNVYCLKKLKKFHYIS